MRRLRVHLFYSSSYCTLFLTLPALVRLLSPSPEALTPFFNLYFSSSKHHHFVYSVSTWNTVLEATNKSTSMDVFGCNTALIDALV